MGSSFNSCIGILNFKFPISSFQTITIASLNACFINSDLPQYMNPELNEVPK